MDEGLGIAMDMSRGSWRRAPHVLFRHAADAQQPCCGWAGQAIGRGPRGNHALHCSPPSATVFDWILTLPE